MSAQIKTWRLRTCPLLLLSVIAAAGIFLLTGFFALAQTQANGTQEQDTEAAGVHVFPVQGKVYM